MESLVHKVDQEHIELKSSQIIEEIFSDVTLNHPPLKLRGYIFTVEGISIGFAPNEAIELRA